MVSGKLCFVVDIGTGAELLLRGNGPSISPLEMGRGEGVAVT